MTLEPIRLPVLGTDGQPLPGLTPTWRSGSGPAVTDLGDGRYEFITDCGDGDQFDDVLVMGEGAIPPAWRVLHIRESASDQILQTLEAT